jgi:hypothetical protein
MDCEGSEYPIIYESPLTLWDKVQNMTVEVHNLDEQSRNVQALQRFLEERKFTVHTEFAHSNCFTLIAHKKPV